MKILALDALTKNDALSLAEETLRASFSEQAAAAVVSFLKQRIGSYEVKGAYEEELCGFIVYDNESFQILFLCVKPQYQNQGCATALVDEVRKEAGALHIPRLSVNAHGDTEGFYRSYGFEQTAEAVNDGQMKIIPMEYLLGREYIGKTVTVTVDRPYGSFHPHHPDVLYPLNYGYVNELVSADGEFQDAYVYGPKEPVESFTGIVSGILYRKDGPSRFIVTRAGEMIDRDQIIEAVAFEEQYYDTRFIWNNELN